MTHAHAPTPIEELHATAQAEFDSLRKRTPESKAIITGKRLVLLPERVMKRFGGAAAVYGWVCIGTSLLTAPPAIRQAVIAHEWGHVAAGHTNATLFTLPMLAAYIGINFTTRGGIFWPMVCLALLAAMALVLGWVLRPKREHEADAIAASLLGPQQLIDGLQWVSQHVHRTELTEDMNERIALLRAMQEQSS